MNLRISCASTRPVLLGYLNKPTSNRANSTPAAGRKKPEIIKHQFGVMTSTHSLTQPTLHVRRPDQVKGRVQAASVSSCNAQRVFWLGIDWTRSIWPSKSYSLKFVDYCISIYNTNNICSAHNIKNKSFSMARRYEQHVTSDM